MRRWDSVRLLGGGVLAAWALWQAATVYLVFAGGRQHRLETAVLLLVAYAVLTELVARAAGSSPAEPAQAAMGPRARRVIAGAAFAGWLAIWLTVADVPFLSDDYVLLARYRDSAAHTPQQFFRPVFGAVFWALSSIGGESVLPFRVAAAVLHVGAAGLAAWLAQRVARAPAAGTIAFAAFLLNPLQAEAVVWIAGLQETLWTFLALAALAAHQRDDWPRALRLGTVIGLSGLAFGAKETAACLVLLLPALDAARDPARLRRHGLTYATVATGLAAFLAVRARYAAFEAELLASPTRYVLKQFVALPYQLYLQPWSTAAIRMPAVVSFATAALGIVGLAWITIRRRDWRTLVAGAFVVLASTLPLGAYFFVRDDLAGARYLYFGTFGWGLLLTALLSAACRPSHALIGAVAALTAAWGLLFHVNLRPWRQAADVVRAMELAAARGDDPPAAARRAAARLGARVVEQDGIPREVGGVWLFVNGYPEFVARVRAAARDVNPP